MLQLFKQVVKLFDPSQRKLGVFVGLSLVVQIGYWYLGSPGPQLAGVERTLASAVTNIAWAVGLLLLIPLLAAWRLKLPLGKIRFGRGDVRFGVRTTLPLALIIVGLLFFGARDSALQHTYPWPGDWLASGGITIFLWTILYALYYVAFEFFYRGFLMRGLETFWGLNTAIWVQMMASVLIHLGKPWVETVAAVPAGLLFAVLAVRSRSLLYPILLHLIIGLSTDLFSLYHQGLF